MAQGLELEWQALLTDNWTFSGSLARNHVEISGGALVPCTILDGTGQETFPVGEFFHTCDIAGSLDGIRKFTGSVVTEYTVAGLLEGADWYLRASYNYKGKKPTEDNTSIGDLDAVGVLNLYTGIRSADGKWDVTLWAENATDEQQLTDFLAGSNFATGYRFANGFIEERRVGVSVGYNF